jgi:crotonobetainyl-CoA:carnitine CoA-transferase CaiB-like acyl-CoA transferase
LELLSTADVFIQSYRSGSLAARGLSTEDLVKINPNLVVANLNAYGPDGPWSQHRGFDSLVQTCSGINVGEAENHGANEPVRVLPCQALDHGAGYLLATGIMTALYKRATEGGSYEVKVSLAGTMKYLRSLGRYQGPNAFNRKEFGSSEDVGKYLETNQSPFGDLRAVKHSAHIEGVSVGWEIMPKALGSDMPGWL